MNMIKIGRTSFVACALTLSLAPISVRAQAVVPPTPPVPPDISIHVQLPDLSDLDLPDFSDLSDILQNAITGIPHAFPAFPALPALPPFALQGPKPVPAPRVKVYTDRDSKATNDLYEQARNAIEQEQYARALGQLDTLITRFDGKSLADSMANRVDAAMYWKAYALGKQRELTEALKTLETMQARFADSRWLKDAMALKVEMMQASGQAVSPDAQTDEDIKLLALRGLMQSDPDRAVPMIEQLLSGSSSIKVKENALFVLSQSKSARAREILGNIAKGNGNPDLQMRAIRYLGVMNGPGNDQILDDAYRSSSDEAVRRAIIRSFMVSGNRARLVAIAGDTSSSPALRGEAVQQLGVMRAGDELARLYARESAPDVKKRIIQGLFISRDATRLVELAKAEKDMDLKKDIVQKLSLMKSKEATDYLVELLKLVGFGTRDSGLGVRESGFGAGARVGGKNMFRGFVVSWPRVGAVLVALAVGLSGAVLAQSQIVNAQLTSRQATQALDAEIQSVAAQSGPAWAAYRVSTVRGPQHMCNSNNWTSAKVMLEPATELTILVRVENGRIERIQTATPDCEVDAGGLPVVWLDGISPSQSAAWLTARIKSAETSTQQAPKIVDAALRALIWHPGDEPINTVVALARDDRRPYVRSQALFWLSQRAGQQAVGAIRNAVDNDPETEVKRKAVFALSQLPKDEGVPLLIDVARHNTNREVRKQAMFWLGQSKDPRAISFFEEVLKP